MPCSVSSGVLETLAFGFFGMICAVLFAVYSIRRIIRREQTLLYIPMCASTVLVYAAVGLYIGFVSYDIMYGYYQQFTRHALR